MVMIHRLAKVDASPLADLGQVYERGRAQGYNRWAEQNAPEALGGLYDWYASQPHASPLSPQGADVPTPAASTSGREVFNMLREGGLSPVAAAGMTGRLQQESGFNPGAIGDEGTAFGVSQVRGPRREGLAKYAGRPDPKDTKTQIGFLLHELQTSEPRAWQALQEAKTIEDAARASMHFMRPAGYTPNNPEAGHGYQNTVNYARSYAGGDVQGGAVPSGAPQATTALASGSFPTSSARGSQRPSLPPREVMMEMFRNPITRGVATKIAQASQTGAAVERFEPITLPDGSFAQVNTATGEIDVLRGAPNAPQDTARMRELAAAGLEPGTPEYANALLNNKTGGLEIVQGADGSTVIRQGNFGEAIDVTKPTRNLLQKKIVNIDTQLQTMDQIASQYDPQFLTIEGSLRAGVESLKGRAGLSNSPEGRDFVQRHRRFKEGVKSLFNQYRKEITGAAAAEKELKDLENAMLNMSLSPAEFEASFEQLRRMQQATREAYVRAEQEGISAQSEFGRRQINQYIDEAVMQVVQSAPQQGGRQVPQAGTVEDGYTFKGGDPADPNNWERK